MEIFAPKDIVLPDKCSEGFRRCLELEIFNRKVEVLFDFFIILNKISSLLEVLKTLSILKRLNIILVAHLNEIQ